MRKNIGKYIFITITSTLFILCIGMLFINNNEGKDIFYEENILSLEYSRTLNLAIYNFDTINPLITKNKSVIQIGNLIFEPLIALGDNYKITYKLAKECAKISDESYIVKLDENAKWQDGKDFTSADVEFTVNLIKNNDSIYKNQVQDIKNIEILDKHTIKINLNTKIQFFEYYLTFPILQKDMYIDKNLDDKTIIPVGTGMYKINNISDEKIVLEKNSIYNKETKKNKIDNIKILLCKNMDEIYQNFKIGNIDMIHTNSIRYQKELGEIGYNLKEFKGRNYDFLSLNCESPVLKEIEVRNAIFHAINKEDILSRVYDNNGYIADFPIDFGCYICENDSAYNSYNQELSKKILQDSGWEYIYKGWQKNDESGKKIFLDLDLDVLATDHIKIKVCEEIKRQLEQIGIILNINKLSYEKYIKAIENKDYDIIYMGITNGFSPCVEFFYNVQNIANYKNTEVISIINEINNVQDEKILKEY